MNTGLYLDYILHSTGPINPKLPVNVIATDVQTNSATIQWTVSSIAYDPETYLILYGTKPMMLVQNSSITAYSSGDITRTNFNESLIIGELSFLTEYFYRVRVTNSHGIIFSELNRFITNAFGELV